MSGPEAAAEGPGAPATAGEPREGDLAPEVAQSGDAGTGQPRFTVPGGREAAVSTCRQCGEEVQLTGDLVKEWIKAGRPPVEHDSCPAVLDGQRCYVVRVQLWVGADEIVTSRPPDGGFIVHAEGVSLKSTAPMLAVQLQDKWNRLVESGDLLDSAVEEQPEWTPRNGACIGCGVPVAESEPNVWTDTSGFRACGDGRWHVPDLAEERDG